MPQATTYDAVMIGTSQGGRFLPIALAQAGRKVALIERGPPGGVCVNLGCTLTKTMVASARLAYLARCGAEYGVHIAPIAVDMKAVRQRKQGIVEGARSGYQHRLTAPQRPGLALLRGETHCEVAASLAARAGASRQDPIWRTSLSPGDPIREGKREDKGKEQVTA